MQVPNVTLEDLQAFQRKHFPGQHQTPCIQENDPIADEDLGYYPDGVKRTLTDEQIEMFRHSEIHSLLRKKQLELENSDYEARMRLPAKNESDGNHDDVVEKRPLDGQPSPTGDQKRLKSLRESKNHDDDTTQEPLDYGDNSSHPPPAKKPPVSRAPYQGRRIISYDD